MEAAGSPDCQIVLQALFALVIKILRPLDATFALKSGDLSVTDKLRATSVT
jgi:hypothetical protein